MKLIKTKLIPFTLAFCVMLTGFVFISQTSYAAQGDYQAKSFTVTQSGGSKKVAKNAKLTFKGTEKNSNVKINIYYWKNGKWAYHSRITIKTGSKHDNNKAQYGYTGSKTIKGKYLTKGVKYRAEAPDYGGAWKVEWKAG